MNQKKFEYTNKDVPFLKKHLFFRSVFTFMFLAIFVWQLLSILIGKDISKLNIGEIIISGAVLLTSLLMAFISLMYVFKNFRIVSNIKKRGKCVSTVQLLFDPGKAGFLKFYRVINYILTLLSVIILVVAATHSILEIKYYHSISFYLPLLITMSLCGFNSAFHIDEEIKIAETVHLYHSIY